MNKSARKLTLDDIGKLAGVSRATVSRVINGYPHITDEVRTRVQQVINETGYRPNKIAQSLASNRTGVIGLVIPHDVNAIMTNPYFLHLINGVTSAINQSDLTLTLFLFHSIDEENRIAESILKTNLVDGVIVTADRRENSFAEQILRYSVPLVYVGRPEPGLNIAYVNANNELGGYLATQHLIERGCRRIATIACTTNTAGEDRYRGYMKALEAYGVAYAEALVAEGDFTYESGYTAMQQLLALEEVPEAVFVASDFMAVGAQRAIRQAGLRMPEDMALVGFDDLPQAAIAEPPLTTIRQPIHELGSVAVALLSEAIEQPSNFIAPRVLPVELVVRST